MPPPDDSLRDVASLVPAQRPGAAAALPAPADATTLLEQQADEYAAAAMAAGTRRIYASALKQYAAWCAAGGYDPLGGEAGPVRLYVAHLGQQGRAVSTIRVAVAAIGALYREANLSFEPGTPGLAKVMRGIVRKKGTAPQRQAKPATRDVLQAMLAACGPETGPRAALGARNRAMLLLGFAAALRRSELVALNLADIELVDGRGVMVTLRRSKTDQEQQGAQIAVPAQDDEPDLCPVRALKAWFVHRFTAPDFRPGQGGDDAPATRPLFCAVTRFGQVTGQGLSDKAVVRLVKAMAEAAGYDGEAFSGHSLRAGLITEADTQDAGLTAIMRQARQTKPETTLRYTRPNDLWRHNAAARALGRKA